MIGRQVFALLERKAIGAVGGIENAIDEHAVDVEIGLDFVFREAVFLLFHLGREVEAVIGLQLEVFSHRFLCESLDFAGFGLGLRVVFPDELSEEGIDVFRGLGHGFLE